MAATRDDILRTAPLPPDDGSLEQAVADLDSKLAAWSGAMTRAQATLKSLVATQEDASPVSPPEAPLPAAETPPAVSPAKPKVEPAPACRPEVAPPVRPESPAPAPAPAGPASAADEDEALLASLDPETVKKIQVLRRLSSQKKSVRELLEKVHATPSASAPAPPVKKSFWRR